MHLCRVISVTLAHLRMLNLNYSDSFLNFRGRQRPQRSLETETRGYGRSVSEDEGFGASG